MLELCLFFNGGSFLSVLVAAQQLKAIDLEAGFRRLACAK